jgi:two-component system sensor histidine kinase ChiS
MTADNRLENLVVSFECGANDYLRKPFNKHELLSRVNTLLKLKSSVQEALDLAQRITMVKKQVEDLNKQNIESNRKVDELIEYDKLKTEFFANISHELRTPLNVISSTIQLLQSLDTAKTIGEERIRYYFDIMNQNSLRLLRLINNLIDTTKFDGGYLNLNLSYGNIVAVVEEITQSVAEYVKSKDMELIFDTETEEKFMAFDEEKIERVMLNILSNAVKFTNEKGKIFVNIKDNDDFIEISVKDTGIGIPEDKVEYIFERFARVDRSTTRRTEGSGIGLSLVKAMIEMHGGSISVRSVLGSGSEFIVKLPLGVIPSVHYKTQYLLTDTNKNKYDKSLSMEFSDIYTNK